MGVECNSAVLFDAAAGVCVADLHNQRGLALCREGDNAGALEQFDLAVEAAPGFAEAHNNRGALRLASGDQKGAFADYEAALKLKPDYAEAYNNRGAARQALGDMDGALADFDRAVGLKPDYAQAHDNRGTVHAYFWNHQAAIADFDAAIRLYGGAPHWRQRVCVLLVCRGNTRYHLNDWEGILRDFHAAARIDADLFAKSFVQSHETLIKQNLKRLLADCRLHLQADPNDFMTYFRRGVAYRLLGRKQEAWADWESSAACPTCNEDLGPPIVAKCGDAEDVAFIRGLAEQVRRRREAHRRASGAA